MASVEEVIEVTRSAIGPGSENPDCIHGDNAADRSLDLP
jgi:hypothetical protein